MSKLNPASTITGRGIYGCDLDAMGVLKVFNKRSDLSKISSRDQILENYGDV